MKGDAPTFDEVFSLAYEELRRLAGGVHRRRADASLSPTALVHEAWVKLAGSRTVSAASREHLRRIVARAMRQVLIDAARRKQAQKRGGDAVLVTFDDDVGRADATADDLLALHEALEQLTIGAPRQAAVVEMRFFGGFEVEEVARLLGVSEATVMRDWRAARAWLGRRLNAGETDG